MTFNLRSLFWFVVVAALVCAVASVVNGWFDTMPIRMFDRATGEIFPTPVAVRAVISLSAGTVVTLPCVLVIRMLVRHYRG